MQGVAQMFFYIKKDFMQFFHSYHLQASGKDQLSLFQNNHQPGLLFWFQGILSVQLITALLLQQ